MNKGRSITYLYVRLIAQLIVTSGLLLFTVATDVAPGTSSTIIGAIVGYWLKEAENGAVKSAVLGVERRESEQ